VPRPGHRASSRLSSRPGAIVCRWQGFWVDWSGRPRQPFSSPGDPLRNIDRAPSLVVKISSIETKGPPPCKDDSGPIAYSVQWSFKNGPISY
jgi:hypothetical protein